MIAMIIGIILDAATNVDPTTAIQVGGGVATGGVGVGAYNKYQQKAMKDEINAMKKYAEEQKHRLDKHIEKHEDIIVFMAEISIELKHINEKLDKKGI